MMSRSEMRLQGKLQNWDVRRGISKKERDPCAMIEPALCFFHRRQPCLPQKPGNALR
jgi:hypothetical protein